MISLDIQSPSLDRLRARWAEAPAIVAQELRAGHEAALLVAQEEVRSRTPVDTGRLRNSIVARFESVIGADLRGSLQSVPYPGQPAGLARWMEEGTRPHRIRARRGKMLKFQKGGRTVFAPSVLHPGTRPYRMFALGMAAAAPKIRRIFSARLGNVTRRLRV